MPGLAQRNGQFSNDSLSLCSSSGARSVSANEICSKYRLDVTFDQLQKFWSELSPHARQELLRIDKQTLFEQARKNLYCSRCNGLLLEGFSQIIMYGKSLQQEGAAGYLPSSRPGALKKPLSCCHNDIQDSSVHPWGGLAATRDGLLTLLDCFLEAKSLKALQNVFDSARARERERELLYPDACGGGGRGWISQGVANYGRGHGTREMCALHTARLSCDTLVDFWSALGDETRQTLLRMKEDDFVERLMYRFDSKRFCRDCRRNVIREFKELKELKRIRREPRCTSWFCVADTAFQYEVSDGMIQADWHQFFMDTDGTYHHFEWAVGTGEGKSDILEFEDVGLNGSVTVNGLDLDGLNVCFITLRAWKLDGRCTELSVKAHALKGQPCVHKRLVVGDGFVTITKGESIRRFFEYAEEIEEEEDDDSMDKDGDELDGEGSRPQKHAKSPELAREFLLDAATVIFKEQVEKAFREGTARQNAHSIFVCLALKLLEERVHVACKEIITLEKQVKLLEEEEKEKREEEERKERRRTKEKEKKLRRKERLKGKERDKEKKCVEPEKSNTIPEISMKESAPIVPEDPDNTIKLGDSINEMGDITLARPSSPNILDKQFSDKCIVPEQDPSIRDRNNLFVTEKSKSSHRKLRAWREFELNSSSRWCDRHQNAEVNDTKALVNESEPRLRSINGVNRQIRSNSMNSNARIYGPKFGKKFQSSRHDFHSCSCNQTSDCRAKAINSRPYGRSKFPPNRDFLHTKKLWEPVESQKKHFLNNSDSEHIKDKTGSHQPHNLLNSSGKLFSNQLFRNSSKIDDLKNDLLHEDVNPKELRNCESGEVGLCPIISTFNIKGISDPNASSNSSSDNCSSCLSEGDSSMASTSTQNADSEDERQQLEGIETFSPTQITITKDDNNPDNARTTVDTGSRPLHNQRVQLPLFPSPSTMGYYHQNPSSWTGSPTNGLMSFPPSNPYLFNSPFGYGHFCMQYGTLQPLTPPLHGLGQFQVYQPSNKVNTMNSKEQDKISHPGGAKEAIIVNKTVTSERNCDTPSSNGRVFTKVSPNGCTQNPAKVQVDGTNFSLFHFGGPISVTTGYNLNVEASKEGIGGHFSSNPSANPAIEEYSLFSASNETRFSFF